MVGRLSAGALAEALANRNRHLLVHRSATLASQLEQTTTLLEKIGAKPTTAVVDMTYRGVETELGSVQILHRGKSKKLTARQKRWVRRRQAIEPVIGHLKADHRMDRCWLKGAEGDALHAVLCAAGFNICRLLRAIVAQATKVATAFFLDLLWLRAVRRVAPRSAYAAMERTAAINSRNSPLNATGERGWHRYVLRAAG